MKARPAIYLGLALLLGWTASVQTTAGQPESSAKRTPQENQDYAKRILGRWLGPTKLFTFYANGTWALQRHEEAPLDSKGRRWHIDGNKLTLTFPDGQVTNTIVSFTRAKFVTSDGGRDTVYERSPK